MLVSETRQYAHDKIADGTTVTGAFDAIDFRGIDNHSLLDEWKEGPRTFLGITVEHFPNMFMSMGPHQAYGNIPRSIEFAVGWIAETIEYCRDHNISYIEATDASVRYFRISSESSLLTRSLGTGMDRSCP